VNPDKGEVSLLFSLSFSFFLVFFWNAKGSREEREEREKRTRKSQRIDKKNNLLSLDCFISSFFFPPFREKED
jgi:hypothetical protein